MVRRGDDHRPRDFLEAPEQLQRHLARRLAVGSAVPRADAVILDFYVGVQPSRHRRVWRD